MPAHLYRPAFVSYHRISGSLSAFRACPFNIPVRVFDIACFAVKTIRKIEFKLPLTRLFIGLYCVYIAGTEPRAWGFEFFIAFIYAYIRIADY